MADKKELSNNEYNDKIFAEVKKLQDKIDKLKEDLKPVEKIKTLSIAECNAMNRKHAKQRAEAAKEAEEKAKAVQEKLLKGAK